MKQLIRWVAVRNRLRLAGGLVAAGVLALVLPPGWSDRLLLGAALLPFSAWMALGRDARGRADGTRAALRLAPRAHWAVVIGWGPGLLVAAAWAAVIARFSLATAPLFAWGAVWVLWADALDRRAIRGGVAWVAVGIGALVVLTAPVWLGPFFGRTALAPALATWTIGAHPTAMALDALGHTVLQDEHFYLWTFSGVLEVRPLAWSRALPAYLGVALLAAALALRSARRPAVE